MESFAPEAQASSQLTYFDILFERTTFLTGWLVEGTIDTDALSGALTKVTQKWRMLSGRLQSMKNHDDETEWRIRIPLGDLPAEYKTYALTISTSEFPLSHYLPYPIPLVSRSLPHALFIHASTPRQFSLWESTSHPLTCWHVTHLPADPANDGKTHTCIGFSRSHGIFDGVGAAAVARALVAELNGLDWPVPSLPSSGFNVNPMQQALNLQLQHHKDEGLDDLKDYSGFSVLGITGALKLVAWHMRERWWSGADRRILLLPKDVLSYLVDGCRADLNREGKNTVQVTTGDILVAWVLKTVYSAGTSPKTIVQCSNLASFRSQISTETESFLQYPHNSFVPLPYPSLTVAELCKYSLPELSEVLASARASLAIPHILSSYKAVKSITAFPVNPSAHENLMISNVSASRILESDWSTIGGTKTLCGYRYQLTPNELMMTNTVYIAGRLADGSVVMDMSLNKDRVDLLIKAVGAISASLPRMDYI
ncbi:hypothetical protein BDZ94DRAFT_1289447 [Collybia nuda]|uniref:Uncharacterized protein n=1 Tax=Collybia nuda TaxID=64659 RepID=A0A9P5Y7V6_9AGAR|nr:hypothetical protein BDZ94DRAFT_1289447 [Collybia nuda]